MYNTQIHVIYMTLAFIMHIYISEVLDFLKKKRLTFVKIHVFQPYFDMKLFWGREYLILVFIAFLEHALGNSSPKLPLQTWLTHFGSPELLYLLFSQ